MERLRDIIFILSALDLHDIENTVWEPYHRGGAGRPPRNPLGIFKALVVKRLRQIPSDRELYRRLWDDLALGEICAIEDRERPARAIGGLWTGSIRSLCNMQSLRPSTAS